VTRRAQLIFERLEPRQLHDFGGQAAPGRGWAPDDAFRRKDDSARGLDHAISTHAAFPTLRGGSQPPRCFKTYIGGGAKPFPQYAALQQCRSASFDIDVNVFLALADVDSDVTRLLRDAANLIP